MQCEKCRHTIIELVPHPEFAKGWEKTAVDIQPVNDGTILVLGREHGHKFAVLQGEDLVNARTAGIGLFAAHQCKESI